MGGRVNSSANRKVTKASRMRNTRASRSGSAGHADIARMFASSARAIRSTFRATPRATTRTPSDDASEALTSPSRAGARVGILAAQQVQGGGRRAARRRSVRRLRGASRPWSGTSRHRAAGLSARLPVVRSAPAAGRPSGDSERATARPARSRRGDRCRPAREVAPARPAARSAMPPTTGPGPECGAAGSRCASAEGYSPSEKGPVRPVYAPRWAVR